MEQSKIVEERGWQASIEERKIKTDALRAAKIIVQDPSPELKTGLAKIGDVITTEWATTAGADGKAILDAFKK
jgi:hypothetical protein